MNEQLQKPIPPEGEVRTEWEIPSIPKEASILRPNELRSANRLVLKEDLDYVEDPNYKPSLLRRLWRAIRHRLDCHRDDPLGKDGYNRPPVECVQKPKPSPDSSLETDIEAGWYTERLLSLSCTFGEPILPCGSCRAVPWVITQRPSSTGEQLITLRCHCSNEDHYVTFAFGPEVPSGVPGDFKDGLVICVCRDLAHAWNARQIASYRTISGRTEKEDEDKRRSFLSG